MHSKIVLDLGLDDEMEILFQLRLQFIIQVYSQQTSQHVIINDALRETVHVAVAF